MPNFAGKSTKLHRAVGHLLNADDGAAALTVPVALFRIG